MSLSTWRFSSIMLNAVFMSAAVAHLMELPAKMRYEAPLYARLQNSLYWNYGRIGGVAEILALLTTGGITAWMRKRRHPAFPLTAAAAGTLAVAHGAFWMLVSPANQIMATWSPDAVPADWTKWREQWEYTHAARAFLATGALGMLTASTLRESAS
jgi:hypothetical protein